MDSNRKATHPAEPPQVSRRGALKAGAAGMAALLGLGSLDAATVNQLALLTHGQPMTSARLAAILTEERAQWRALLDQVGVARMEVPGAAGEWSLKEVVAHLTWYERAVVTAARQLMREGTFTRPGEGLGPMDERNARIAAEARERPLVEVLTESEHVFAGLLALLPLIPDQALNDASLFGLPEDIPPWMRVANNSYAHYRQHAGEVRAWLDATREPRVQPAPPRYEK